MSEVIETVIFAPSVEAQQITRLLDGAEQHAYQILRSLHDMGDEISITDVMDSRATLVIVHQETVGFNMRRLQELTYRHGESARVVVALVDDLGDMFDAAREAGAIVYRLPLRQEIVHKVDQRYEELLAQAASRMARSLVRPAPVAERPAARPQEALGIRRQALQVITTWSSKGGDGKSLLAMELAYTLAMIASRRVLLVDVDMSRGYLASALGEETLKFAGGEQLGAGETSPGAARGGNIANVATKFLKTGRIPSLSEYVFNYPPAFGRESTSNLDILFGLAMPDQAGLKAFTENGGQQAADFIRALKEHVMHDYEFLIFDSGSLITVHAHSAALREASELLVVSSPIVPAIQPTRAGLELMKQIKLIDDKLSKASLVLNRFAQGGKYKKDEYPRFINLQMRACLPVLDVNLLHDIINDGKFVMEAYLDGETGGGIEELAGELIGLAEYFSPGTIGAARELAPKKKSRSSGGILGGLKLGGRK